MSPLYTDHSKSSSGISLRRDYFPIKFGYNRPGNARKIGKACPRGPKYFSREQFGAAAVGLRHAWIGSGTLFYCISKSFSSGASEDISTSEHATVESRYGFIFLAAILQLNALRCHGKLH